MQEFWNMQRPTIERLAGSTTTRQLRPVEFVAQFPVGGIRQDVGADAQGGLNLLFYRFGIVRLPVAATQFPVARQVLRAIDHAGPAAGINSVEWFNMIRIHGLFGEPYRMIGW